MGEVKELAFRLEQRYQNAGGTAVVGGVAHEARLLDPKRVVIRLKAKQIVGVDLSDFLVRTSLPCQSDTQDVSLVDYHEDTRRSLLH